MKKPSAFIMSAGTLALFLLLTLQTSSKAECNALFEFDQLDNSLTVHFTNLSTSEFDITSYLWNFGDGHTGDGQNPNHTYEQAGSYEVCLTIHDNHDCNDTYCHLVIVEPVNPESCNALFEFDQLDNSLTVHFTNLSTSQFDITSYLWNFGDGHTGDGQNPNHTYDHAGSYEVCLTIHDNHDCNDTYCHLVIVEPVTPETCNALFEFDQLDNSLTVHFTNLSTSEFDITSFLWNFGDGHTGDGQNPNHTYEHAGSYEVCLTIHDNHDCNDTYCHLVIVEPVNPEGCNALFEFDQLENSLTVHFINLSTSEFDITSYLWDFGDGHSGDGQNPNHTYEHAGSYEVCLTIHDNHDCTDTYCHLVIVETGNPDVCNALFEFDQLDNSLTVHFINQSTSEFDITSYLWNFGDGHTGDGQNPNHTYEHAGTYEVCLTIHDNHDCTDTFCHLVIVEDGNPEGCNALFEYDQFENSLTILFMNLSSSEFDITSYLWNFGDGHTGDGQNPHHTYNHPGSYEVCLTIHDNHDCNDTYCHLVIVEGGMPECDAAFTFQIDSASATVHFTNTSVNTTDHTTFQWLFGDGTTSDDENPVHTYSHNGEYNACLIIRDTTIDCVSDVCHVVHIFHAQGAGGLGLPPDVQNVSRTKAEDDFSNEHLISVFPNPFSGTATIRYELRKEAKVTIELGDLFGNRIRTIVDENETLGIHTHPLYSDDLLPGIYMIKLFADNEIQIKKITITN